MKNLPTTHKEIIRILRDGGRIELGASNNRVITNTGGHYTTITDAERRALVEYYDLKPVADPTYHWVMK